MTRGCRFSWRTIAWLAVLLSATFPNSAIAGHGAIAGTSARVAPESLAQDGDLIFQCGKGLYPALVAAALPGSRGFCHVGVVVRRGEHVLVAHVEPGQGGRGGSARLEDLAAFLDSARRAALYRLAEGPPEISQEAAAAAARFAEEGRPFDWDLDRETADRLYCTELVWRAYREAGCSLVREQDLDTRTYRGRRRCIITPASVLKSGKIRFVARLVG